MTLIVIAHIDERMGTRARAPIDIEEERIRAEIQTLVKDLAAEGIEHGSPSTHLARLRQY